jgi:transcriptional regulator with XRE-family HTH domain
MTFSEWLSKEIKDRGLSFAEVARRGGISHARISQVISGGEKAGADFCLGIARALNKSPYEILRRAELLPPEPEQSPGEADMLHNYRRLPKSKQQFVLDMMRGLLGAPPQPTLTDSREQYTIEEKKVDKIKRLQHELAETICQLSAEEAAELNDPRLDEAMKSLAALSLPQINHLVAAAQDAWRQRPKSK